MALVSLAGNPLGKLESWPSLLLPSALIVLSRTLLFCKRNSDSEKYHGLKRIGQLAQISVAG